MEQLRHERALREKGIQIPVLVDAYNQALCVLEQRISNDAFAETYQHLYRRTRPDGLDVLAYNVPGHELDFTMAVRAYSNTPRLLLKVPEKRRGDDTAPVIIAPKGRSIPEVMLGWGGQPLPENSVLKYPNLEGPQTRVEERPEAHWSGVEPGKYVIIGHIYNLMPEHMKEIFSQVFQGFSRDEENLFKFYEENATVEDLRDILLHLTDLGYSNFYGTDQGYVNNSEAIFVNENGSGFRKRAKDKELCSTMFIPGDVRIGYAPQEEITGGGFAAKIITIDTKMTKDKNDTKEQAIRPLSSRFAEANYFVDVGDDSKKIPVPRLENSLLFREGHPARLWEPPIAAFLDRVGKINEGVQLDCRIP